MGRRIKKILLIDPPGSVVGINTGLAYLAGSLLQNHYQVTVLDFNNYKDNLDERLKKSLKKGFDVIGFSLKSLTIINSLPLVEKCKEWAPQSLIVAGGPGVTVERENFLKLYPPFDYALSGEGELSFPEFLEYLKGERKIGMVGGLVYKKGKRFLINENDFIFNLDQLPFPDYSVFDKLSFKQNNYPLVTSRGCPYNCLYCAVRLVSGRIFRSHSPERVVKELELAKVKYQIDRFEVYDDTFTQNIERAKSICLFLLKRKLGLSWMCENGIRADRIDKELIRLMKKAGCQEIWLGIESLDPEVFKLVNKGEKIESILSAVKLAKKVGMKVSGFFIIGLPGSTYKKDETTLKEAKTLGLDKTTWSLATPFPHTPLWDWVQTKAKVLRHYSDVSFFVDPKCTFETEDYKEEERLAMFYRANLSFRRYTCLTAEKNLGERLKAVLKIIWKYDKRNLLSHIFFGFEATFRYLILPKLVWFKRKD